MKPYWSLDTARGYKLIKVGKVARCDIHGYLDALIAGVEIHCDAEADNVETSPIEICLPCLLELTKTVSSEAAKR